MLHNFSGAIRIASISLLKKCIAIAFLPIILLPHCRYWKGLKMWKFEKKIGRAIFKKSPPSPPQSTFILPCIPFSSNAFANASVMMKTYLQFPAQSDQSLLRYLAYRPTRQLKIIIIMNSVDLTLRSGENIRHNVC